MFLGQILFLWHTHFLKFSHIYKMCLNDFCFIRFIALELRMVTFDGAKDYPGHFEVLVHSHILVCGLIQIIIEETQIASTKLAIFRDRTRSRESLLPPHLTLRECGFIGDSQNTPEESVLFYDYTVEFTDCPILMCDHYFGKKAWNLIKINHVYLYKFYFSFMCFNSYVVFFVICLFFYLCFTV